MAKKVTNGDLQNATQTFKDRATRTPLQSRDDEYRCSEMVPAQHIGGQLCYRYSVTINLVMVVTIILNHTHNDYKIRKYYSH